MGIMNIRRALLQSRSIEKETVSGSFVTFNTNIAALIPSMSINVQLIQSGTGDPSVDNPRMITGRSSANIIFNNDTITIDWSDTAGTIYQGLLDVINGILQVTRVGYVITEIGGDTGWVIKSYGTASGYGCWLSIGKYDALPGYGATPTNGDSRGLCSYGRWRNGAQDYINEWRACITKSNSTVYHPNIVFTRQPSGFNSVERVNELLDSLTVPLVVCYDLATPIVYQLDPVELQAQAGQNTVSSDCGDMTLEYWTY
ncbi:MAG: hypothetical protein J6T99_06325 [Oscillospiraceae bacterium]|nr:hypothetical protein [Oscillospiraceae bacterium]